MGLREDEAGRLQRRIAQLEESLANHQRALQSARRTLIELTATSLAAQVNITKWQEELERDE